MKKVGFKMELIIKIEELKKIPALMEKIAKLQYTFEDIEIDTNINYCRYLDDFDLTITLLQNIDTQIGYILDNRYDEELIREEEYEEERKELKRIFNKYDISLLKDLEFAMEEINNNGKPLTEEDIKTLDALRDLVKSLYGDIDYLAEELGIEVIYEIEEFAHEIIFKLKGENDGKEME